MYILGKLFTTYDDHGNGGSRRICAQPTEGGYERMLRTVHEVDINYSVAWQQFIRVIIVYRHFRRPSNGQKFSQKFPDDRSLLLAERYSVSLTMFRELPTARCSRSYINEIRCRIIRDIFKCVRGTYFTTLLFFPNYFKIKIFSRRIRAIRETSFDAFRMKYHRIRTRFHRILMKRAQTPAIGPFRYRLLAHPIGDRFVYIGIID